MKPIYLIMLVLSAVMCTSCFAQHSSSFTYLGKAVTPEAIFSFLPGMESNDTVRPYVVNLKDSSFKTAVIAGHDAGWLKCDITHDEIYGTDTMHLWESIEYEVMGTVGNKFILLVYYNGGGSLTFAYVFVLTLNDNKILRVANYLLSRQPDDTMVVDPKIKGNELINGVYSYKIPK